MKIKTLLKSPILTQSGYGNHSRQIFQSLINDPLFDVCCEPLNWGITPYVTDDSPLTKQIKECVKKFIINKHQEKNDYDLFIHVTIPNEFQKLGKVNVGVTAGIESDRISHVWVQKCNEMDLVIVPSEHSKKTITDTVIDWQNDRTGEKGSFKLNKPIIVCPEGVNTEIFKKLDIIDTKINSLLDDAPDFNFLHVGQWGQGGFGDDRKNISNLVKYFIEEFHERKDVGLVLKINMARNSVMDKEAVVNRLKDIKSLFKEETVPPITLLHGNFTETEMASLYNHPKIKAFISLTHGEGFGLPLCEAAACELPIIATNWSGHLDFLKLGKFSAIDYEMKEIPERAVWEPIMIKGSAWACVKEEDVKRRMKKMVTSYSTPKEWAVDLASKIKEEFDLSVVCDNFVNEIKLFLNKGESQPLASVNPIEHLKSLIDTPEDFNVVYTMPMASGDVYISTAVIDGLMKQLPENAKIYFATKEQYAGILLGNPNIYKVIPWQEFMINLEILEEVFDLALTPDIATHYMFSNWIRGGHGRLLAQEYANNCQCELGDYFIAKENYELPDDVKNCYMTIHTTSGKGQWEGRNYSDWQEVINNLKSLYPNLKIVQVGCEDEPKLDKIDVDLRGKTNYQQLACIVGNSMLHLSPDTFTMHLAAGLDVPLVALFGCSYASSTGPWVKDMQKAKFILMQSERLSGCAHRACYKNKCKCNPSNPSGPICEIDPKEVFQACAKLLKDYE